MPTGAAKQLEAGVVGTVLAGCLGVAIHTLLHAWAPPPPFHYVYGGVIGIGAGMAVPYLWPVMRTQFSVPERRQITIASFLASLAGAAMGAVFALAFLPPNESRILANRPAALTMTVAGLIAGVAAGTLIASRVGEVRRHTDGSGSQ
jgi:MFS family permease